MKTVKTIIVTFLIAGFVAAPFTAFAADSGKAKKVKPYPLGTCAVSDEKIGGDMGEPFVFVHDGREVKLCCKECKSEFDENTAKFTKKIDEAAKKVKPYPLKTCAVSDEELGSMGEPYVFIHEGREVKLCCKDCKKQFDKTPAKFMSKWNKDGKAQSSETK